MPLDRAVNSGRGLTTMPDAVRTLRMNNGLAYEIRPCVDPEAHFTAQDWKAEIRKGLAGLSTESRWQRFATGAGRLSERQLDYLTDVDGHDRVAWCAVIAQDGGYRGIGVSRFVRLEGEAAVAEFAVTVIDEFQGQGVGRALLAQLLESARNNGMRRLRGHVLPSNRRMLALCRELRAVITPADGFLRADIPVL